MQPLQGNQMQVEVQILHLHLQMQILHLSTSLLQMLNFITDILADELTSITSLDTVCIY